MELVRVTESAALAAARWVGRGNKDGADAAAVEAMRLSLSSVQMDGVVVIGEGEKDHAPMLFNGEKVGDGHEPLVDVAVDPIDGTTLTAKGLDNALSVIAVSERGTMFDPGPSFYMQKIAVGPECVGAIDITASVTQNLRWIAKSKQESVRDLTVVILDRPRHADLIDEVRSSGARIRMITDGDVYGAIASAWPGAAIDVLIGIGGTPEGVIAAAALKSMGGEMQARLCPQSAEERSALAAAGYRPRPRAHPGRSGPGRQLLLRRHRRHRRPSPARRAVRRPRRPHAKPGDALPQRHGASDRRLAQSAQTARVQRDRLHLIRSGGPLR